MSPEDDHKLSEILSEIGSLLTDHCDRVENLQFSHSKIKARLQVLREHIRGNEWDNFVSKHPSAISWFNDEGIPND